MPYLTMLDPVLRPCCWSKVWLDKHWDDPALSNVRERLCLNETASAECAVPPAGFPHGSPELWCQAKYDSSECSAIKAEVRCVGVGMRLSLVGLWS